MIFKLENQEEYLFNRFGKPIVNPFVSVRMEEKLYAHSKYNFEPAIDFLFECGFEFDGKLYHEEDFVFKVNEQVEQGLVLDQNGNEIPLESWWYGPGQGSINGVELVSLGKPTIHTIGAFFNPGGLGQQISTTHPPMPEGVTLPEGFPKLADYWILNSIRLPYFGNKSLSELNFKLS